MLMSNVDHKNDSVNGKAESHGTIEKDVTLTIFEYILHNTATGRD